MKTELRIIDERQVLNKEFRIYGDFENPLFLAKDVAEWIEHSNPTEMLKTVDEDEKVKIRPKKSLGLLTNNNEYNFLTENGLYEVLFQSRKPIAKEFKKQVKGILKEIRKTGEYQTPKKKQEKLSSINNAARTILPVLEKAGMKPEYQVYMLNQLYGKVGLEIPMERVEQEQRLYDKTAIAKKLGVLSKNGNPHAQAIGAIISKVDIEDDERELTSFERNGHVGTEYQYKESVIFKIQNWLEDNSYPSVISKDGKTYKVSYTTEVEVA
jgi:putative antirepressor